jgi:hypothetical protein
MTILFLAGTVIGLVLMGGLVFLGVIFYFYTLALKEAWEEGWDMPN